MKTGVAHLPLHSGKAPRWLFDRMKLLAREITLILCQQFGPQEFLKRISDPFWFQAFGCVLGFDWHSSGLTTTTCGALKIGLHDISKETGLFVCGGKGATSRKTPQEIENLAQKRLIQADSKNLIYASRMSAKVDNTALQDGYQLYHHTFFLDKKGNWAVVQQGMNEFTSWARRYHWLSEKISDFVCEPHNAICCDHTSKALNMVAKESEETRDISAKLAIDSPEKTVEEFKKITSIHLPKQHPVRSSNIKPENLKRILLSTYQKQPQGFEQVLSTEGVGPKTIRALALISELVYGKSPSFKDPVRFSFAHGGKDGHPYPVNRKVYDGSIQFLKQATSEAKIGRTEKMKALKRLDSFYKI